MAELTNLETGAASPAPPALTDASTGPKEVGEMTASTLNRTSVDDMNSLGDKRQSSHGDSGKEHKLAAPQSPEPIGVAPQTLEPSLSPVSPRASPKVSPRRKGFFGNVQRVNSAKSSKSELSMMEETSRRNTYVVFWRTITLLFILSQAVVFGVCTWYFARLDEKDRLGDVSRSYGRFIFERFPAKQLDSVDSLLKLASIYGNYFDAAWPNVTLASFNIAAIYDVNASLLDNIIYSPLVSRAQETAWEAYATANVDLLAGNQTEYTGGSWPVRNGIYRYDDEGDRVEDSDSVLLCPAWQIAPVHGLEEYVMFNQYSESVLTPLFDAVATRSVTSATSNISVVPNGEDVPWIGVVTVVGVYDDVDTLVGFMSANYTIESLLRNTLPSLTKGIDVVVQQDEQSEAIATYRLDGYDLDTTTLGDTHNPNMEGFRQRSTVILTGGTSMYFVTYPTRSWQEKYYTNIPVGSSLVVVGTILVVSLIFIIYDVLVSRRERMLEDMAAASSGVVRQLFPNFVREKLLKKATSHHNYRKERVSEGSSVEDSPRAQPAETPQSRPNYFDIIRIRNEGVKDRRRQTDDSDKGIIAQSFEHASVLFADIAGFTKWSSGRDPEEVFAFLEVLFAAFDFFARERGVFKVETIGDCYVASTGAPKVQSDHAEIMADFALDILRAFDEVIAGQAAEGVSGVRDIKLRVGFHSGPVIAGLIRGDRGRFQLFGDTVHFANQMESTGVPGNVHVSHAAWKYIQNGAGGRGHVLTERFPSAKTKDGPITSYFLTFRSLRATAEKIVFLNRLAKHKSKDNITPMNSRKEEDIPTPGDMTTVGRSGASVRFNIAMSDRPDAGDTGDTGETGDDELRGIFHANATNSINSSAHEDSPSSPHADSDEHANDSVISESEFSDRGILYGSTREPFDEPVPADEIPTFNEEEAPSPIIDRSYSCHDDYDDELFDILLSRKSEQSNEANKRIVSFDSDTKDDL